VNLKYCFDGDLHSVEIEKTQDGYIATVNGQTYQITLDHLGDGELCFRLDDHPLDFYWAAEGPLRWMWINGETYLFDKRTSLARGGAGIQVAEKTLRSPMPGQVTAIHAEAGSAIEKGQTLVLLEAMKMEIRIQAPQDGQLERVLVEVGQTVERDQALVELK
jgi:acetyl/propionyl-CoA carboxylase alpha subunit